MLDLNKLSAADFQPHLHTTFLIHVPGMAPWEVELITITELSAYRLTLEFVQSSNRAFSIILRSPTLDHYLDQHIYEIEHPIMGRLALFLVPIGPDGEGMCYEAVFN